jgi:hypothetical protein
MFDLLFHSKIRDRSVCKLNYYAEIKRNQERREIRFMKNIVFFSESKVISIIVVILIIITLIVNGNLARV